MIYTSGTTTMKADNNNNNNCNNYNHKTQDVSQEELFNFMDTFQNFIKNKTIVL